MNVTESATPPLRLRWEWAIWAGLALALAAMFLWTGTGDGSHLLYATLASGLLVALGWWSEGRWDAGRTYAHLLMAGGAAGFFGSVFAAHAHEVPALLRSPWLAWALLAVAAAALFFLADTRRSPWLAGGGLTLAHMGLGSFEEVGPAMVQFAPPYSASPASIIRSRRPTRSP